MNYDDLPSNPRDLAVVFEQDHPGATVIECEKIGKTYCVLGIAASGVAIFSYGNALYRSYYHTLREVSAPNHRWFHKKLRNRRLKLRTDPVTGKQKFLKPGNALPDDRYTLEKEWCGDPEQKYILRFCGDWVSKHEDVLLGVFAAHKHDRERF